MGTNPNIEPEIKEYVLLQLAARAQSLDIPVGDIHDDDNFVESGLVDSFGLLELLTSIEYRFNIKFNFSGVDPSEFTTLKGIVFYCARAVNSSNAHK